jgi:hypothetical protein
MVWPKEAAGLMREAMEILRNRELKGINKSRLFFEQTALNFAVERRGIPVANLDYRFNGYLADAEISDRWPDHPELRPVSDCWFVHFAGGAHTRQGYPLLRGDRYSQTQRAELMEQWIRDNYGDRKCRLTA